MRYQSLSRIFVVGRWLEPLWDALHWWHDVTCRSSNKNALTTAFSRNARNTAKKGHATLLINMTSGGHMPQNARETNGNDLRHLVLSCLFLLVQCIDIRKLFFDPMVLVACFGAQNWRWSGRSITFSWWAIYVAHKHLGIAFERFLKGHMEQQFTLLRLLSMHVVAQGAEKLRLWAPKLVKLASCCPIINISIFQAETQAPMFNKAWQEHWPRQRTKKTTLTYLKSRHQQTCSNKTCRFWEHINKWHYYIILPL